MEGLDFQARKIDPSTTLNSQHNPPTRSFPRLGWKTWTLLACSQAAIVLLARSFEHSLSAGRQFFSKTDVSLPAPRESQYNAENDLDYWIDTEAELAWRKIFQQIGPPAGAHEGLVIASPSTDKPDYLYTWTRDSAIVTSVALDGLLNSQDTALEGILRQYAYSQRALQRVCNPSGCFEWGLRGLGEPKYHVNGTAFTGNWGRPQRDGPALRAITLSGFAHYLMDRGTPADVEFVTQHLYEADLPASSVIKADLEYVAQYWEQSSWDLWEEIDGEHFFTFLVSYTALQRGALLAERLNDTFASDFYSEQAQRIKHELRTFIDADTDRILAYHDPGKWKRTGLDAAVLLGVLVAGTAGVEEWGPANDYVLVTLKAYVDSFRDVYEINRGERSAPVATGRYAEDVYDGVGVSLGNPWYLTTLSVSHVLSRTLAYYRLAPAEILVSAVSLPFWAQFDPTVVANEAVPVGSRKWRKLLFEVERWSDGFWAIVKKYQGEDGQLAEQFHRDNGIPQGAKNLTWSYASFYLAHVDRARYYQATLALPPTNY